MSDNSAFIDIRSRYLVLVLYTLSAGNTVHIPTATELFEVISLQDLITLQKQEVIELIETGNADRPYTIIIDFKRFDELTSYSLNLHESSLSLAKDSSFSSVFNTLNNNKLYA